MLTLILPYQRSSHLHIPRRDLVLSASDSLTLRVSVVESDSPSAMALNLTGGIGGPSLRVTIWRRSPGPAWDYGALQSGARRLWTGFGVISPVIGSFDVSFPAGTMARWPARCGWSIHLDFDGGEKSEILTFGWLHVSRAAWSPVEPIDVLTDGGDQILVSSSDSALVHLEA